MKMKKVLVMMLWGVAAVRAAGQDVQEGGALQGVTVAGARTVQRVDGQWVYPTRQQLSGSSDGYALLAKLTLPHIRVDETAQTISALSNLGAVQVRINDVVASRSDLLALDMQAVERIEYTDSPGVRYGEGIAYLINIIVRRPVSGYVVGTRLSNAVTTAEGSETVYGKLNRARSELAIDYRLSYADASDSRHRQYDERATYELSPDATVAVHRHSSERSWQTLAHDLQLTYSLSDSAYVLQARLSGQRDIRPQQGRSVMCMDDGEPFENLSRECTASPALDLYYHQDFRRHQSLTANVVGTYIKTDETSERNEGSDYRFTTDGQTWSLWGEAVYENRLKPFTLSSGAQYSLRYSHNVYAGDAAAVNDLHTSGLYLFSQLKGRLGKLGYMGGLGVSRQAQRQAATSDVFWLCRPKFTLSYPLAERLKLKYDFEVSQHVSRIALTSDVSIKQDALVTVVGNPAIRPNRVTEHSLHLTYTTARLTADLEGYYRLNAHCNLEKYIRADGHFYKTQTNADNQCNLFYVQNYNRYELLPERLSATLYGAVFRFLNYGEDYTHTYTTLNGGGSIEAYLGRWTLSAYADSGWRFMEGEHRGHGAPLWYVAANYRVKQLMVGLSIKNPFCANPCTDRTEVVSRYLYRDARHYDHTEGNKVTLTLTWSLSAGRRYRDITRTMTHHDSETGILK